MAKKNIERRRRAEEADAERKQSRLKQKQNKKENEKKIAQVLSDKKRSFTNTPLAFIGMERRAPKLFKDPRYSESLSWLSGAQKIRPVENWKPSGKTSRTQFVSLVKHCLVKYDVPNFFYNMFDPDIEATPDGQENMRLFFELAKGGSIHKSKNLPSVMTKKMRNAFMKMPAHMSMKDAKIHAMVKVWGGSFQLAREICGWRFFHIDKFWAEVIHWFCRQSMMDNAMVRPLLDYINYKHGRDLSFSMKGRTLYRLIQNMEKWHIEITRNAGGGIFEPSGKANNFVWKQNADTTWTISEILTYKELRKESKTLQHCAYSYKHSIERGALSLWSMQRDGERRCTVELSRYGCVVQMRGKFNRLPKQQEMNVLRRWATENNLTISKNL